MNHDLETLILHVKIVQKVGIVQSAQSLQSFVQ